MSRPVKFAAIALLFAQSCKTHTAPQSVSKSAEDVLKETVGMNNTYKAKNEGGNRLSLLVSTPRFKTNAGDSTNAYGSVFGIDSNLNGTLDMTEVDNGEMPTDNPEVWFQFGHDKGKVTYVLNDLTTHVKTIGIADSFEEAAHEGKALMANTPF